MQTTKKTNKVGGIRSVAVYSHCEQFRYTLTRTWNQPVQKRVVFIGLNPSTATELQNDPTVARCMQYARDWGFDEFTMLNVFAFRATDPKKMKLQADPIGPDNDWHIRKFAKQANLIICCWGNHGTHHNRSADLLNKLESWACKLHCLKLTKTQQPGHPLYLRKSSKPFDMSERSDTHCEQD